MPVLIPAGLPALARGFRGQVRGLEVWLAPGGVRCDTGAFSTGSPQTPKPCTPKIARVVGFFTALACLRPQAAPLARTPRTGTVPSGNTGVTVLPRARSCASGG